MTTSEEIMAQYVATEARVDRMRDKYALEEGYISEDSSPWVPFVPNVFIKHLTFDVRGSSAANVLWVQEGGTLGRHRHRGPAMSSRAVGATWSTTGSASPVTSYGRARAAATRSTPSTG